MSNRVLCFSGFSVELSQNKVSLLPLPDLERAREWLQLRGRHMPILYGMGPEGRGDMDWHCTETADLTGSFAAFRWSEVTVQTEWHGQIFCVNSLKGTSNIIFFDILTEVKNDSQDISRGICINLKK